MRAGATLSLLLHLAILLMIFFGLPDLFKPEEVIEPVAVQLATVADITAQPQPAVKPLPTPVMKPATPPPPAPAAPQAPALPPVPTPPQPAEQNSASAAAPAADAADPADGGRAAAADHHPRPVEAAAADHSRRSSSRSPCRSSAPISRPTRPSPR